MTAVEWPSLDALLADATPVEPVSFDLDWLLDDLATGQLYAREQIARYINSLRVDIETSRSLAVELENENAELRDNMPHIEGTSGRCLACGEDWICTGWSQELAVETDYDRLTALQERVTEAAALLSDALLWHSSETDNTAVACQEALALLTGEAE